MQELIKNEEYEQAAVVRDEIKKSIYSTVYCITEKEKRVFENSACVILPFDE